MVFVNYTVLCMFCVIYDMVFLHQFLYTIYNKVVGTKIRIIERSSFTWKKRNT